MNDLIDYGYDKKNNLEVLSVIAPPGFDIIKREEIFHARGSVAILLLAPFDPRKGMADIANIINRSSLHKLIIIGRPRCSIEALKIFFDELDVENISWYVDVDFKLQKELYFQSRVLLFPSMNEGIGLPILEAYSCGLRVLLYDKLETSYLALPEDRMSSLDEFRVAFTQTLQEGTNPYRYWEHFRNITENRPSAKRNKLLEL